MFFINPAVISFTVAAAYCEIMFVALQPLTSHSAVASVEDRDGCLVYYLRAA